MIDLGLRIKMLRENKNLSQENLANDCDIPKSQITRIEKARINTTVKTLVKISNALGVEFKELF
ncbi:helix-turn-helix domain-containing protein [Flavobacterium sp. 3HN19-14]|uniref:helix-turn-helix domain-containing protein n=1 Tax=Flavobacterium sp. 3HN19-14 TaxID=3448133 RepID=UPI003EE1EAEE